ncbi:unnamed protein product [Vitrella brassicaformis CCMP3155]|uniref:AAA+ ATPase domain-containing protein n=8 Tax=Vitrella brassicaformis TaxID=1169539 RepID=A0A0G4FW57_VITBC|nr:unnamed protein product [Vitrella brassicaformis CCMP3155]|eukprot:CEM19434.1 unnamed protein product [Vitrella brassicaformis CCMP3155]
MTSHVPLSPVPPIGSPFTAEQTQQKRTDDGILRQTHVASSLRTTEHQKMERVYRLDPQKAHRRRLFRFDASELESYAMATFLKPTRVAPPQPGAAAQATTPDEGRKPIKSSGLAAMARMQKDAKEKEAKKETKLPSHVQLLQTIYMAQTGKAEGAKPIEGQGVIAELEGEGVEEVPEGRSSLVAAFAQEQVDEEELLRQELAKLKTGEDAIAFFAKNGSTTPVKFVYCNRRVTEEGDFQPCSLVVVPEADINPEYFTISSSGVVHVCPQRPSEYVSLSEWMHQSLMFSVLRSMVFFKHFLIGKLFRQWQNNARYQVYLKQRKTLTRRLFLAKPVFVAPLLNIHSIMHDTGNVRVMHIAHSQHDLHQFAEAQSNQRSNPQNGAAKEFETRQEQLIGILDKVVAEVHASTQLPEEHPLDFKSSKKVKPMVQEKEEAKERARRLRLAALDESLLGDFIRLVDYKLSSQLVHVVLTAGRDFLDRLGTAESSVKLFSVTVKFGQARKMDFEPGLSKFKVMLHELWTGTINLVASVPPFCQMRQYEGYVQVVHPQSVETLLLNDEVFSATQERVEKRIVQDFERAQKYCDSYFAMYRRIYDFEKQWDETAFFERKLTHASLSREMGLMRDFEEDLEKLKQTHIFGVLSVEARTLKMNLVPVAEKALAAMKIVLIQMAREKAAALVNRFTSVNKLLDERPAKLANYADFVRNFQEIKDQLESLDEEKSNVEEMYSLLKQYDVRVPLDDTIQLETLNQKASEFEKQKLLEASEHIRENMTDMVLDLRQKSQKVEEDMLNLAHDLQQGMFVDEEAIVNAAEVREELTKLEDQLQKLDQRASNYRELQQLFKTPEQFAFKETEETRKLFALKQKLWDTIAEWQEATKQWYYDEFSKLDVEDTNKKVQEYFKNVYSLAKSLNNDPVVTRLKEMIGEWRDRMPTILELGNPALRPRHWEKIFKEIKMAYVSPAQSFFLKKLEENDIFSKYQFVAEVSGIASGEFALEQQLDKIRGIWADAELIVQPHRESQTCFVLGDITEIIAILEDHTVTVQTMMGSRFIAGIRAQVEEWERKLNLTSDVLDEWIQVQRAWMYLENIFSAEDIQKQLPAESAKFMQVDKFWKDLLKRVRQSYKNVIQAVSQPDLLKKLQWANKTLEEVQKSLEDYLETKRAAFPRFYFLSNDELLSILSQTRNPHAVQEHLSKCFDAMHRIKFTDEPKSVTVEGMKSIEGEYVPFASQVMAQGPVEGWLTKIEEQMRQGLYEQSKSAWKDYPEDALNRQEWLFAYPAQTILMVDLIYWTFDVETALNNISTNKDPQAMETFFEFMKSQISKSVALVRSNLTKLQRKMMGALIVLDVHARDVVRTMILEKCSSVNDFEWTKQLRYYWEAEIDNCTARQTNTRFLYAFEYLGNTPRLVITPLTDKCYMTLTGALHLNYGGAPAGPAGTGKTETTKDLAKALAVQCVVFNCSDGLDYKMMGRFFSGLAQAGAWACFDEFNRIDVEVLSVIAQQMLKIQSAIRGKKTIFEFEGREIPLNSRFGVFITMNPGYAGRTELPDNLKSLFRPVAMMIPDYGLIAEIILFSEGFDSANSLARKMVNLYKLSSEQLSKQDHYDFGMRAVKSVLVMAGTLKRSNPDLDENIVLIRAMRDSNVPKFLSHDLPLFMGIISDLFPDAVVPYIDYGDLQKAIEKQLRDHELQVVPAYVTKVIQLLETQIVRHGVMLVGVTGTGKTTCSDILAKALTQLRQDEHADPNYQVTKVITLNPKSVTMDELYGATNPVTNEWTDGLIGQLVREACSDTSPNKKWVNFDGPVDALWIENMNTVLDDNKTLCLANGERIKLPSTLTMMFEVQDLAVASPATVSRCGMVYLEPLHLGWKCLVQTWGERFTKKYADYAKQLEEWTIQLCDAAIPFIRKNCREVISSVDANLIDSFCRLMWTFIDERNEIKGENTKEEQRLVRMYWAFSAVWSLGGNLHENSRPAFSDFLVPQLQSWCPEFPSSDCYSVSVDNTGKFITFESIVPDFEYDPRVSFFNILVPTQDTVTQKMLLENIMTAGYHCLWSGDTGVGKSVGIQNFLNHVPEGFVTGGVNFSAQTTSANLQDVFESKLIAKRKNLLGPPPGTRMLIFIDDVNMPQLETYGAQPPIELLRQVMDHKGFYDRKKLFYKSVKDVQYILACAPPGGGRNAVTPRLFRHYNMFWMTNLGEPAMVRIFSSILGGWLQITEPSLKDISTSLIKAGVEIYLRIVNDLLPTPSKSHYTFNLRDPSKVVQGMLMIDPAGLKDKEVLTRLWIHESCRQFRDRLIDDTDRSWFNGLIQEKVKTHLGLDWAADDFKEIIFGDFLGRNEKPYQLIDKSQEELASIFDEYLQEHNITFPSRMNLVFFKDAQHHLARICRIIRQPRGNALLIGVGGSGRNSLSRLAAFMSDYHLFSIEIAKKYGTAEFREDIKSMMMNIAKNQKPIAFFFSDTQIVKESFLEDINNIVNTGEVPNLFAVDETEQIIGLTRPAAKAAGKPDARDAILQYFVSMVRDLLHIILAFSPVGEKFRARCRQFPSIVNCCTIDWFNAWPPDALYSVANRFYSEQKDLGIESVTDQLCKMSGEIHDSVTESAESFYNELRRRTYTTPTSYLELIKLYLDMLKQQRELLGTRLNRYKVGMQRMEETNVVVDQMKRQLIELQPVLDKASKDTAELMVVLEKDQQLAQEAAEACKVDEIEASKASQEAQEIKDDCQRDLDEALPEYYAAIKALDSLDKKDIQEVKSFAKPPQLVETVMSAVCLFLGRKQTWDDAKKLLNEANFMQQLKEYNKDAISNKLMQQAQKYITMEDFNPQKVSTVSKAATSLCMWVKAMDTYAKVARNIEPKKERLRGAEASLKAAEDKLAQKQAELKEVQDRVAALLRQYEESKAKSEKLQRDMEDARVKLDRAQKLVAGLGNEAVRWEKSATELEEAMSNLIGNIILSAGMIAYLGPFTASYRQSILQRWGGKCTEWGLKVDPNYTLEKTLADPAEVREWNIKGLPADQLSIENGIFVTRGRRWPLMIDPQGQANKWIKNTGKTQNIQVIRLSEPNFLRSLENGIRMGNPVLLENVEEILDPAIEPVLQKQTFKKGGQVLLRLGDTDVPYSPNFRFYITTKMANPHYLPEVCIKVTIINFTVTQKGLEDQLLIEVVNHERPDLEEKRNDLVVSISNDKATLANLEQEILRLIAEAGDNILESETLINTLDESKKTSETVGERMKVAEVTAKEINDARESYRSVALRGSLLYFVIADLALIDPMYQYSLDYFVGLFNQRLAKSQKSDVIEGRLSILLTDITTKFYENICRGLFERHKLLYSFLNAVSIFRKNERIQPIEWMFFLRGVEAGRDASRPGSNEGEAPPEWVDSTLWQKLKVLEETVGGSFGGLSASVSANSADWQAYRDNDNLHKIPMPDGFSDKLTPFQQLLLVKSFREENLLFAVRNFVAAELGKEFVEPPPFDLLGAYQDSKNISPIIFVLSPGADPIGYLLKLAKENGPGEERLHILSLGQGQGVKAERLIELARQEGDWVCLQNCHLAASWMPSFERIQEQQNEDDIDPNYRLWLTSMPTPTFPVPVLQSGIKITNEPPKGLKANLTRSFLDISENVYESCIKGREFKKLLFALAFFHAVILERRKFGPIGWNIPYEWMNSDFEVSLQQLNMYLTEQPGVPYQTLNYIVSEVNYGGRVTDDKDVRLINAILARYFCADIMDDGYQLAESDIYHAPPEGNLESVRNYVHTLPMDEEPDVFGLHMNANITCQEKEARDFLDVVISVQPRIPAGGSGKTTDEIVYELAESIEARIPAPFDRSKAHPATFVQNKGGEGEGEDAKEDPGASLSVFFSQELDRFDKLIRVVKKSLADLQKAIKGLVVMSAELETMYNSFLFQKVPTIWLNAAYPCLKPLASWVNDFIERLEFLQGWLVGGPPLSFWLPSFFFPQGFMTGTLQRHARKTRIPIDTLTFRTEVSTLKAADITEAPERGVNIHGLFLQGAGWDVAGRKLCESAKGQLFVPMPVIWIDPVDIDKLDNKKDYRCPLYKTSTRAGTLSTTGHSTNFVLFFDLHTDKESDHWIRRGVALLCQLDD